jgi:hypothetical protein
MKKLIVLTWIALGSTAAWADEAKPAPPPAVDTTAARQCCTAAMNADPTFAKSIGETFDKQLDQKTIAAHQAAQDQIAENQLHVILAYAAMWILAAGFVVFLWRRQQVLRAEIAQLRKDLEAKGAS